MGDPHGFACGLVAGTTTAAVFTPVDRALFLAHVHKRPFLRSANFSRPFQGVNQLILHRIISSGMCFPLEDFVRRTCPIGGQSGSSQHNFVSGIVSGSAIAVVTNPLAVITAQKWSAKQDGSIFRIAQGMFQQSGLVAFNRGIWSTIARDSIWGGLFSLLRHGLPKLMDHSETSLSPGVYKPGVVSFTANVIAAGVATAVSSPLNYARNLQFAHAGEGVLPMKRIFSALVQDAEQHAAMTGGSRALFIAQRMAIGWGTLRVSVGLALSSQIYAAAMLELSSSP